VKLVISKTETDDALIAALKEEVQRLKEESKRLALGRRGDDVAVKIERASKGECCWSASTIRKHSASASASTASCNCRPYTVN